MPLGAVDVAIAECELFLYFHGAFGSFGLLFHPYADAERVIAGFEKGAGIFASIAGENVDRIADILDKLAAHLEGGRETRGTDFERIVLVIAREFSFDGACEIGAEVDVDAFVGIDLYADVVGRSYLKVDRKIGCAFKFCLNEFFECVSVYHRVCCKNKEETSVPSGILCKDSKKIAA